MKTNTVLFLALSFLSLTVKANLNDLEDGILNSDVEKVKTALAAVTLTEHDKDGLTDIANDIIRKRLKNIELLRFGLLAHFGNAYIKEVEGPATVIFLGLVGIAMSFFATNSQLVSMGISPLKTILSAGVTLGGLVWLDHKIEIFIEKVNQAHIDAVKIKKLIYDKVCVY